MVSGGTVRGQASDLDEQLGKYGTEIAGLDGNWEGASYNKTSSESQSFISECKDISTGMGAFASACDAYENYISAKKVYEDRVSRRDHAVSNNVDGCNDSVIKKYEADMKEYKEKMEKHKKEIEENLAKASSIKIKGASGSASGFSNTWTAYSSGVANQLGGGSGTLPNARLGENGRPDPSKNIFFQNEANGGINGFPLNGGGPGKGGNCTYYAYSRFSELIGQEATGLASGDACSWYSNTKGFKKGQEPRLGAIAVWQYGNSSSNGHVAVVEKIEKNGDIVVSEGGWSSQKWYGNNTYKKSNNYATGYSNGHLLGFIYPEKA